MNNNSFYSIDRLVEFGLGLSMAQQMVQMMNQTMQTMYVPGSIQSMPATQMPPIYVALEGVSTGPLTEAEFVHLVTENKVTKDTLVWMPGMLAWQPIEQTSAILKIIAFDPPPLP